MSKHRDVWAVINGPIPEGGVIHHIDLDPSNNDTSNLRMFLTQGEHMRHHASIRPKNANLRVLIHRTIALDALDFAAVQVAAREADASASQWIRAAIREKLEREAIAHEA
jgi:HNH endonuclease